MTILITSDLHLSDRPRDQHRFGLFQWLRKQQLEYNVEETFILGDITETKDCHSSALVNRIVNELAGLTPPVYILKGNHDYIDPMNPFFRFLNLIEGLSFVIKPRNLPTGYGLIPHCKDQTEFDLACGKMHPNPLGVMVHQTFDGAIAETGARLTGLRASPIELLKPKAVWAGDVHKPQRCGLVTYVGAPYTVRFGDDYTPRVLLVRNGVETDLHYPCPRKWSLKINDSDDIKSNKLLKSGDQVKIEYSLTREEVVEWQEHKQDTLNICAGMGLEVFGVDLKVVGPKRRERVRLTDTPKARTPNEIFLAFCQAEKIAGNIQKAGFGILKE